MLSVLDLTWVTMLFLTYPLVNNSYVAMEAMTLTLLQALLRQVQKYVEAEIYSLNVQVQEIVVAVTY